MAGDHSRPGLKIALIQGSIDSEMKTDPDQVQLVHKQYLALSDRAVREHHDLDLIVWPETMFSRTVAQLHARRTSARRRGLDQGRPG